MDTIYNTFFRNCASGYRRPFRALDGTYTDDATGCCGPLRAAAAHAYAYWFSFIGNVLGMPGKMNAWVYDAIGGLNKFPPNGIWMLGYMDVSPQGYDPNVAATAIRDGNFDYPTNTIHKASNDGVDGPLRHLGAKMLAGRRLAYSDCINRSHEGCARWLDCWPSQIGGSFDVADSRRSNTCRRGL